MKSTKIWARREIWSDDISLYLVRYLDSPVTVAYPDTAVWRTAKPEDEGKDRPPFITLEQEGAQRLMDALWDAGLRPSEGMGSAGQLAAVQNHLKDMRVIVGKQLGVGF